MHPAGQRVSISSVSGTDVYAGGVSVDLTPPEGVPLARLTAEQGAQVAHGVGAVLPPAHPRLLEPLTHYRLARALHRPRADHPAVRQVLRIIHAMQVAAQVVHHL